jgi:hypothetical protein
MARHKQIFNPQGAGLAIAADSFAIHEETAKAQK